MDWNEKYSWRIISSYHGFGYNSNNPFSLVENIMNQGFIAGRRQTYANSPDIRHPGRNCGF